MEVDPNDGVSAGLLEQLGSLQTLDHDDLVSQMLRLVGGSGITAENAKFYLEMNGWNVQAAVCAYFDLEASSEAKMSPPQMTFIKDVTIGEGESVPPKADFVKTWKVQNTGSSSWPEGCVLRHAGGTLMTSDGRDHAAVGALLPYQMCDIAIQMRAPETAGIYESKWRISTAEGLYFGDAIWVIITVEPAGTLALTQQMNNFSTSFDGENNATHQHSSASTTTNPFSPKKRDQDEEMS